MNPEPVIRPMGHSDLNGILDVEFKSFSLPWSRGMFEDELFNPKAFYLVLEISGQVVGYAGLWRILDEGHITNVAVHPDFRRKGFGRLLIEALISYAREWCLCALTLEVRRSNAAAIALYESFGFKSAGYRKRYYSDNNEDALIMWLHF